MATYKVWLTVKDSYGNIKEVEGGTINVDLSEVTPDEVSTMGQALLDSSVLEPLATDQEVETAISEKVHESLLYSDFLLQEDEENGEGV